MRDWCGVLGRGGRGPAENEVEERGRVGSRAAVSFAESGAGGGDVRGGMRVRTGEVRDEGADALGDGLEEVSMRPVGRQFDQNAACEHDESRSHFEDFRAPLGGLCVAEFVGNVCAISQRIQ